ncbi:MAG: hypothetical protein ABJN38_00015 [Lentilitoribacter sp.]
MDSLLRFNCFHFPALTEVKCICGYVYPTMKLSLCLACVLSLSLAIGPTSFIFSQAGQADDSDIYIVLGLSVESALEKRFSDLSVREIGPVQPLLARLIVAPPTGYEQLKSAGYTLIPASALAALCGIDVEQNINSRT